MSLCYRHLMQAALAASDLTTPEANAIFGENRPASTKKAAAVRKPKAQVVYYARRGQFMKIGTTTNLPLRMSQLRCVVVAVEPGRHWLEKKRHEQFAQYRADGEWFAPNIELETLVADIRDFYGPPNEAWEKIVGQYEVGDMPVPYLTETKYGQ